MAQRVKDAKIEFYSPADGTLRSSLTSNIRRIDILEVDGDVADDATFLVNHDFADLDDFVVGDECRVYIQTDTDGALVHIWTGVLDSIGSERQGPAFADLPLKAQDYVSWTLAHTYVTDSFADMTAGAIVRNIVENFAPEIDVSNVEDTGTTVPSIVFYGESLLSAIRRLAQFANATFRGDKDKALHFFEKASQSSGLTVDTSKVVRGSFRVETSFGDFGNVVTVYGGKRKTLEQNGPTTFSSFASITGLVREKVRFFFSKSKVARIDLWTDAQDDDFLDYLASPVGSDGTMQSAGTTRRSQAVLFTQQHTLAEGAAVKLRLKKTGTPTGTATLRLSSDKDSGGLTSTLDVATLTTAYADISFTFGDDFVFDANETYYLTLVYTGGDASNNISLAISSTDVYAPGTRWSYTSGPGWTETAGTDYLFYTATTKDFTGSITVRIQADNATGTAPTSEADPNFDLASITLPWDDLENNDWSHFDLPDHIVPPGNYVWLIVESDSDANRVGKDGSSNLMFKAYFDLPVIAQKLDLVSAARYGRRELKPIYNDNILTEEEAEALAARVLAEHSSPVRQGRYEVQTIADLSAAAIGETVSATFAKDGIPAGTELIVARKEHAYDSELGTYSLTHDFVDLVRIAAVNDVLRSFHDRIKALEDKNIARNVISLISTVGDLVGVSDSISHDVNLAEYSDSKVGSTSGHAKVGTTHRVRPS